MLYLNSVDSTYSETEKYYRFTLPRPITTDNKSLSLRLVECEIPITYFNIITDYNNEYNFRVQGLKDGVTTSNYYKLITPSYNIHSNILCTASPRQLLHRFVLLIHILGSIHVFSQPLGSLS